MPTITDPLVLPKDVTLTPVAELPESLRAQLTFEENDVAVSRAHTRTPSKIISRDSAELLRQFTTPKTIVEALIRFSAVGGGDPRALLESAFPIIQQLVNDRLLIPENAVEKPESGELPPGTPIAGFSFVRSIQRLEDTELLQVTAQDGSPAVIKIQREDTTKVVARRLEHEAAVLRLLAGDPAPRLIEQGMHEGRQYLAVEWCPGVEVSLAAAELRDLHVDRSGLLSLALGVVDAYSRLHARGVLHGDVHPGNTLVDATGRVRLVDFGLARVLDENGPLDPPPRGGVMFFFEPEYARSSLARERAPQATAAGEQYALAALIYFLTAGGHYLNFSLEREVACRQIAHDPPLPFTALKTEAWPELEAVLTRALSKNPEDRFVSVAHFADALRAVLANHSTRIKPAPPASDVKPAQELLNRMLRRVGWEGDLLTTGVTKKPTVSITYGAAGVAYFLYRVAGLRQDADLLALSDVWITRCAQSLNDQNGFYNPEIGITVEDVGRVSPYHTPSGVCAVRYLVAHAIGDLPGQMEALTAFTLASQHPCKSLDLALGKAGVLLIAALLYDTLPDKSWADHSRLRPLGDTLLAQLWQELGNFRALGPDCELRNLGAAHGWAGLIYASLRWCQATGTSVPLSLPSRMDQLAACAEPHGRGVRWPWELGHAQSQYMPGWCNGSSGQVFLWALAWRMFQEKRFLDLALQSGWNVWEDPARVPTLCCGLAGRGHALLHLHRLTRERPWLNRARILAEAAAASLQQHPSPEINDYEHSLYKGHLGVAQLVADLECPDAGVLPFFESEYARS